MSFNWDQKNNSHPALSAPQAPAMVLDEEALAEIQENPEFDVFEDDEQDTQSLMSDANLRLEQGRLYQMVLSNDIFGETDADPKAIRNVQREIRKYVRERMEVMLGIKQEQTIQAQVVSSPFNDLEVTALKMLASKVTKGASEDPAPQPQQTNVPPKKDGITSINGNLRLNNTPTPVKATPKPLQKTPLPKASQPAKSVQAKSAISKEEGSALQKPIDQMSDEELAAYNKAAEERSSKNRISTAPGMVPHPSAQQLEALYTVAATNMSVANPWRAN